MFFVVVCGVWPSSSFWLIGSSAFSQLIFLRMFQEVVVDVRAGFILTIVRIGSPSTHELGEKDD
jgi:hypothetical protein